MMHERQVNSSFRVGSGMSRTSTGEMTRYAALPLLFLTHLQSGRKPMTVPHPIRTPKTRSARFNLCRVAAITLYALLATTGAFAQFTAGVQGNIRDAGGANI